MDSLIADREMCHVNYGFLIFYNDTHQHVRCEIISLI